MKGLKKYQPTPRVTVSAKAVAAALAVIVGESAALTLRELRRKGTEGFTRDGDPQQEPPTVLGTTPSPLARALLPPSSRFLREGFLIISPLGHFHPPNFFPISNIEKMPFNREEANFIFKQKEAPRRLLSLLLLRPPF